MCARALARAFVRAYVHACVPASVCLCVVCVLVCACLFQDYTYGRYFVVVEDSKDPFTFDDMFNRSFKPKSFAVHWLRGWLRLVCYENNT